MDKKLLVGVDGGGTYTRIAITDLQGKLLTYLEKPGSANIYKDSGAKTNVQNAIRDALQASGYGAEHVACIVSGIAGYDAEEDLAWVQELTQVRGLDCIHHHLNDAFIATLGAFVNQPGIIVVAGTGCIIFGLTEDGQQIRNYDFGHYVPAHARGLVYDAVCRIIADETDASDAELLTQVLAYFQAKDIATLAHLGAESFRMDDQKRNKFFAEFAPALTVQASSGSNLAQRVCTDIANNLITGIRMLGACFASDWVSVALVGGVVNSLYMHQLISSALSRPANREYALRSPALPAVLGAITKAMELKGIPISDDILDSLRCSAKKIRAYSKAQSLL